MEQVDVTVYYLEMLAPARADLPAPRDGLSIVHVPAPTVPFYRSLYGAVGKAFHWRSRRKMSDEALAAILNDPRDVQLRAVVQDVLHPQAISAVRCGTFQWLSVAHLPPRGC